MDVFGLVQAAVARNTGDRLDAFARRIRAASLAAMLAAVAGPAGAASGGLVPLPPPRPRDAAGPPPAPAPLPVARPAGLPDAASAPAPDGAAPAAAPAPAKLAPPPEPQGPTRPAAVEPDPACARLLAAGKVDASPVPAVVGPGGCGIAAPVVLRGVLLPGGRRIPLEPPATMRCDLAEQLGDWVRDDLAGATAVGGRLVGILAGAAYDCRSRDHIAGARLSEHATGNAIDLRGLRLTSGDLVPQRRGARPLWDAVRTSACARFATVLGPGSDSYHAEHVHLDLAHRRGGMRLCQWTLPDDAPQSAAPVPKGPPSDHGTARPPPP